MFWGQNKGKWKAGSCQELNPGHLACTASALPLSYNSQTTTSPHNPLYVLHRWDWNASVAHPAVCCQNLVGGWPESSLHQERTYAEWFSLSKCLELLPRVTTIYMFEAKIEESERAGSHQQSNRGHLACAATELQEQDNQQLLLLCDYH